MKSSLFGIVFFLFAISLPVVFVSCDDDENDDDPDVVEVEIRNNEFDPDTITIEEGTAIRWRNYDNVMHTVTSDSVLFDSGNLDNDDTFLYTFGQAGVYNYHCEIHTGMNGTVIVQ